MDLRGWKGLYGAGPWNQYFSGKGFTKPGNAFVVPALSASDDIALTCQSFL
jgi:hypothetical protein